MGKQRQGGEEGENERILGGRMGREVRRGKGKERKRERWEGGDMNEIFLFRNEFYLNVRS